MMPVTTSQVNGSAEYSYKFQAWCSTTFTWIFLSISLLLFIFGFGAYITFTVNAWGQTTPTQRKTSVHDAKGSQMKVSQLSVPVQCTFSKLPFLAKIESILTWSWTSL